MFGHRDRELLEKLLAVSEESLHILRRAFGHAQIHDFTLIQIQGDSLMPINGVPVGGSGTFQIGFVPPNGVPLQSGPTVTVDDPLVTLGPVGQPAANQFTASVAATDTATSFNVTITGVNGKGTTITHTFNIPITQLQITDFTLDQVA